MRGRRLDPPTPDRPGQKTRTHLTHFLRTPSARAVRPLALACLAAGAALTASAVQAQTPPDRATVGAGVAVLPAYAGSDEMVVVPVPIIDVKHGRFYANLADGAGVYAIDTDHFRLGGGLSFVRGQREEDLPMGVDDLSNSAGATLLARYTVGRSGFTLDATRALGGAEGTTVEGRVSQLYRVNRRLIVIPSVALTWADDKTMEGYFGVDADESAASGLEAFTPDAGMRDLAVALTANIA